jgi:hypothetical protein
MMMANTPSVKVNSLSGLALRCSRRVIPVALFSAMAES